MILQYAISVFITQLVFIGARTWNVRCIATQDMTGALISGTIVHLSWLVSIAIGAVSMNEILTNFNLAYLPVVACSLTGGLIGTYLGLKEKKKK
jgi:uncharacterized membrane protein